MAKRHTIKKCKQCGNSYAPFNSLQVVCSPKCALKFNEKKETAKRVKQMKADLKTHQDWTQILQVVFNEYIRKRDHGKECVSCPTVLMKGYHAGHYFPTTKQATRFDEDNVHGQCVHCNLFKHGNLGSYTDKLKQRIGWERFENLHAKSLMTVKLSIPEIQEKITHYKNLIKQNE